MRLIDADKLKEHKFLTPDAEEAKKWLPAEIQGYQLGWNDCIDAIVDNAPPIETTIENLISTLSVEELKATTRFKVDTPSGEAVSFRREKTGEWIEEIIEELESRKDYGTEYAQAMEDVIVILKAKFGMDMEAENER